MGGRTLMQSFAAIVRQALPGARRRFTQELASALRAHFREQIHLEDGQRYMALDFVEIADNPMWREITVGVKLQPQPSADSDLLTLANRPQMDQPRTWTFDLTEGAEAGGEQVFIYTFRHTLPVQEGLRELRDLVAASYVSREKAIQRLKEPWGRLQTG